MKENINRRIFLRKSAVATTGMALVASSPTLFAFSNSDSPFKGYHPYAEEKCDLRTNVFGKHIAVKGKIFDASGKSSLANATVEVWHLSPGSEKFRHRAKLKTNSTGEYAFITDEPFKEQNTSRKILFKVSHNSKTYFTQLHFLQESAWIDDKHWIKNQSLEQKLLPKVKWEYDKMIVNFNISL